MEGTDLVGRTPHSITRLGIARTFQNIRLFRDLSVLDNVRIAHYGQVAYTPAEALLHIGRFRRRRKSASPCRRWTCFPSSNSTSPRMKKPETCLTACSAGWRSPGRWRPGRNFWLLDEPAAGMNPNEILQLMDFIRWIRKTFRVTIILIEHQMRLVMGICERLGRAGLRRNHRLRSSVRHPVRSQSAGSLPGRGGGFMTDCRPFAFRRGIDCFLRQHQSGGFHFF